MTGRMKTKSEWIDQKRLSEFDAEGTDAHRLCTTDNGWVERYGREILVSYKKAGRAGTAHPGVILLAKIG